MTILQNGATGGWFFNHPLLFILPGKRGGQKKIENPDICVKHFTCLFIINIAGEELMFPGDAEIGIRNHE